MPQQTALRMETPDIAPLFKADSATLSFYATKDGRITVTLIRVGIKARLCSTGNSSCGDRRG